MGIRFRKRAASLKRWLHTKLVAAKQPPLLSLRRYWRNKYVEGFWPRTKVCSRQKRSPSRTLLAMGIAPSVKFLRPALGSKRRQQVAAVCYRIRKRGIEFLLVQTRGGRW